jgi:DNA-binding MarR family transcriptional regulator
MKRKHSGSSPTRPQDSRPAESRTAQSRRPKSFKPFDPALDFGVLPQLTGFGLRRAQLSDFSRFAKSVGDKTATQLRFSMLALIGANPGLQQAQLAEALGLSRPMATVTIDYWEKRGCVERRSHPRDRRSNGIHISPQGREVLAGLQQLVLAHDRHLTERLTDGEVTELRRLLAKIYHR